MDEAVKLLTLQDDAMRGFASAWPAPRWIKVWRDGEPEPVMAWLNSAYAEWYLTAPHEYIGKPDSVIWPPEVCTKFKELDLKAISRAGEIVMELEPTPRGKTRLCLARKFAFRMEGAWGIYGEICPLEITGCPVEGCPRGGSDA